MPYTLYADGAVLQQGVLDKTGQLVIDHQVATQHYRLAMANGVSHQVPVPSDYRNVEQGHLANRGLRKHRSQTDGEVSQPASDSDHRALYAATMDELNERKGTSA